MPEIDSGEEFYVGYQTKAPPGLARWLRVTVIALLTLGLALAAMLVIGQHPFEANRFEFQQYRDYEGTFHAQPVPRLRSGGTDYLLAGEGKHGVTEVAPAAEGQTVKLRGAKIENGPNHMLELLPGTLRLIEGPARVEPLVSRQGPATYSGEIVDTKCHFGVMNPGSGKVHRDCAVRCLSGGLPPGLLVRDASGVARVFVLVGTGGRSLGKELLPYIAEPVRVSGEVLRFDSIWALEIDPVTAIHRE